MLCICHNDTPDTNDDTLVSLITYQNLLNPSLHWSVMMNEVTSFDLSSSVAGGCKATAPNLVLEYFL